MIEGMQKEKKKETPEKDVPTLAELAEKKKKEEGK